MILRRLESFGATMTSEGISRIVHEDGTVNDTYLWRLNYCGIACDEQSAQHFGCHGGVQRRK